LASIWDSVEESYVKTCKDIFKELRVESEEIIQYFYHTKKAYIEFLSRPDHKQTFVTQWQKMYNEEIPEDMRSDADMKAELHQQAEDLKERLWDICDHRRDEAEEERQLIMSEQWLEDHLGLIINHHISLIQNEIDRYQHSLQFLRDYYLHMEGKPIGGVTENYHRLPLLDVLLISVLPLEVHVLIFKTIFRLVTQLQCRKESNQMKRKPFHSLMGQQKMTQKPKSLHQNEEFHW
jgi:hypothetical protein